MTGVFDGMAGVLNDVFGAPVTIHPGGGGAVEIRGVIRDRPVQVADAEGGLVWSIMTTLKAQTGDAAGLVPDDLVIDAAAKQYRVQYPVPTRNPAADRFETFVLEEV